MPPDPEKVCLWGQTGSHRYTVRTTLLTQKRHTADGYSITSSARASGDDGIIGSSILAVFRFRSSSNFANCSTGRLLAEPLRTLSTYTLAGKTNERVISLVKQKYEMLFVITSSSLSTSCHPP